MAGGPAALRQNRAAVEGSTFDRSESLGEGDGGEGGAVKSGERERERREGANVTIAKMTSRSRRAAGSDSDEWYNNRFKYLLQNYDRLTECAN